MNRREILPATLKYTPLPAHRQKEISDLYKACSNELHKYGDTAFYRKKYFKEIVKLYYSYYTDIDLEKAYAVIATHETYRYQSKMIQKMHGDFGKKIIKFFGTLDNDGNDVISLEEFKKAFTKIKCSEEQIELYFKDADKNGDGELDLEELFKFISINPEIYKRMEKMMTLITKIDDEKTYRRRRLIFGKLPVQNDGKERRPSLSDVRPIEEQIIAFRTSDIMF